MLFALQLFVVLEIMKRKSGVCEIGILMAMLFSILWQGCTGRADDANPFSEMPVRESLTSVELWSVVDSSREGRLMSKHDFGAEGDLRTRVKYHPVSGISMDSVVFRYDGDFAVREDYTCHCSARFPRSRTAT